MLPNIDEANPATLSEKIINNILREELGFDGVIITDDMTMGAIVKNYDIGDASVKSLKAGSDIILVCHDYENYIKVINAIKDAVDNGEISLDCINQKVYRILKLKEKYNIEDRRIDSIDVEELNKETRSVLDE
jgi:beta-N-acetylhexosaminidase